MTAFDPKVVVPPHSVMLARLLVLLNVTLPPSTEIKPVAALVPLRMIPPAPVPAKVTGVAPLPLLRIAELIVRAPEELLIRSSSVAVLAALDVVNVPSLVCTPMVKPPAPGASRMPPPAVVAPLSANWPAPRKAMVRGAGSLTSRFCAPTVTPLLMPM